MQHSLVSTVYLGIDCSCDLQEELSEEDYAQLLLPMLNAHWRRAATADPDGA